MHLKGFNVLASIKLNPFPFSLLHLKDLIIWRLFPSSLPHALKAFDFLTSMMFIYHTYLPLRLTNNMIKFLPFSLNTTRTRIFFFFFFYFYFLLLFLVRLYTPLPTKSQVGNTPIHAMDYLIVHRPTCLWCKIPFFSHLPTYAV